MFLTKYTSPNLYPVGANIDKMFEELFENSFNSSNIEKYPATDIYTENGITNIEIAITGFSEDDIEVVLEDDILTISGSKEEKKESEERNYHIKNIAKRNFIRKFNISNKIKNIEAKTKDGVLYLELIPEEKKEERQQIKINKG